MVSFGPRDTVPEKFKDRLFYQHNPTVTPMRTTVDENARLGEEIAWKVARSAGPAVILLPLHGVSAIDRGGEAFDDPAARESLLDALRENHGEVELVEMSNHINDPEFAETAARRLIELIRQSH